MFKSLGSRIQPALMAMAKRIAPVISANTITYFSVMLLPLIWYFMGMNYLILTIVTYLLCSAFFDLFDGPVARRRIKLGYPDDRIWGGYVDAMADKIRQIGVSIPLMMISYIILKCGHLVWYESVGLWSLILLCGLLIASEIVVGSLRTSTYWKERGGTPTVGEKISTHATDNGKTKTAWQVTGLSFGILGLMGESQWYWSIYVANLCLVNSFRYGYLGFREKIRDHRVLTS